MAAAPMTVEQLIQHLDERPDFPIDYESQSKLQRLAADAWVNDQRTGPDVTALEFIYEPRGDNLRALVGVTIR